MQHIMLFVYMFAIFFGIAAITMIFLAGRKQQTALHKSLRNFVLCLLAMSLYDMLIYYTDYILGGLGTLAVLRLGNCLIAILFFFWISMAERLVDGGIYLKLKGFLEIYTIIYLVLWISAALLFDVAESNIGQWLLFASDVILIVSVLSGSLAYIGESLWNRRENWITVYLVLVTALLASNFGLFLLSENTAGLRGARPVDLTIIFWLLVYILTLITIYRLDFARAYAPPTQEIAEFDLDRQLMEISESCQLTARETELTRLIYEGKSNQEISRLLFISESTVKTHIYNIFRKMNAKNRIELIRMVRGE